MCAGARNRAIWSIVLIGCMVHTSFLLSTLKFARIWTRGAVPVLSTTPFAAATGLRTALTEILISSAQVELSLRIAMLKRRERPEPNVCMKNGKSAEGLPACCRRPRAGHTWPSTAVT